MSGVRFNTEQVSLQKLPYNQIRVTGIDELPAALGLDRDAWGFPPFMDYNMNIPLPLNGGLNQQILPVPIITLGFKKLHESAEPLKLDPIGGGYPLYALHDTYVTNHGAQVLTGLAIVIPAGWYATISTSRGNSKIFLVTAENCKNLSVYIDSEGFYQIQAGQEVGRLFLHKDPQIMVVEELSDQKGGSTGR